MEVIKSIQNIYCEINNYSGNFGDPIVEFVNFNPLDYVDRHFPAEIRIGAAIGLIVNFCSHADNTTFSDAQKGSFSDAILLVITKNWYQDLPEINRALKATQNTEKELKHELKNIYNLYIKELNGAHHVK